MANRNQLADRCRKTKMCKFFLANACERGDSCAFAHSFSELRSAPDLRRTQVCPQLLAEGSCNVPDCKFAHDLNELRSFPGPSDECQPSEVLSESDSASTVQATYSRTKPAVGTPQTAAAPLLVSPQGALTALVTATVTAKAAFSWRVEEDADQLGKDIVALRCVQAAVTDILLTLEQKASKVGSANAESASTHFEGSSAAVSPSGSFSSEIFHPRSAQRSVRFEGGETSEDVDARDSFVSSCRSALGSTISDFQDIERRPVNFSRSASEGGDPRNYQALGLCVKNTFFTLEEEESEAHLPGVERRRSSSAPPRMMEQEQRQVDESDVAGSGEEGDVEDERREHNRNEQQKTLVRRRQTAKTLPSGAQRAIEAAVEKVSKLAAEPLPVGPIAVGPVRVGPTLLGSKRSTTKSGRCRD
eukprot:TRINITY_DN19080_c0_g1_i1.p1 TRINITY_DN19080_c0_g1~~TRINITY_DN19080_c0_g1_i1.p1  ORF type:complete len:437 (+),score=72.92 TRINITY_DN19080_c0_g1_i1:62-1312(+)